MSYILPLHQMTKEYDFVVVGAGSAGCPLASRLSEDKSVTVLLIEAGPRIMDNTIDFETRLNTTIPAACGKLQHTAIDWEYYASSAKMCQGLRTWPHTKADVQQKSFWPRGKGLGGSSLINYMAWVRGHAEDYNRWQEVYGNKGWNSTAINAIFDQLEKTQECDSSRLAPHRQQNRGVYGISHKTPVNPLALQFLEACQQLGYEHGDYNATTTGSNNGNDTASSTTNSKGVVGLHQQSVRQGTRCHAARVYLDPLLSAESRRPNLFVLTGVQCQQVALVDKRATGVVVVPHDNTTTNPMTIHATKEVILSAGALGSPQLLLQSGIGPGLPHDMPEVGQHLEDHLMVALRTPPLMPGQDIGTVNAHKAEHWTVIGKNLWHMLFGGKGILTSSAYDASVFISESGANWRTSSPKLQLSAMCAALDRDFLEGNLGFDFGPWELPDEEFATNAEGMSLVVTLLKPKSHGSVTLLADKNNNNGLAIDANYLSDPEGHDLQWMIQGLRHALAIVQAPAFAKTLRPSPFWPLDLCEQYNVPTQAPFFQPDEYPDAFLEAYTRRYATTLYHPVGTCRMGPSPKTAVVDARLRVHGIANLRVADASIQPEIVAANTQASCVAIGEKAAPIIYEDHGLKANPSDLSEKVEAYELQIQTTRQKGKVWAGLLATAASVLAIGSATWLVQSWWQGSKWFGW